MTKHYETITDLIANDKESPLPMSVIPNYMGINLCSVEAISWQKQNDGQLTELTIHFIPATPEEIEQQGGLPGEQSIS